MNIVIFFLVFFLFLYAFVRLLERLLTFKPSRQIFQNPNDVDLFYEDIHVLSQKNKKLHGWFIPAPENCCYEQVKDHTILYMHGNAGNVSDRLAKVKFLHDIGFGVFIFDYSGYGLSDGRPSEQQIYADARAAYDYLLQRDDVDPNKIIAFGSSLGGAVAVDVATYRTFSHLIIEASFSCARDMAQHIVPFIPSFLLKIELDSIGKIDRVKIPKLFLHSRHDQVVPFDYGYQLFQKSSEPKVFQEIQGSHVDDMQLKGDTYRQAICNFFDVHTNYKK